MECAHIVISINYIADVDSIQWGCRSPVGWSLHSRGFFPMGQLDSEFFTFSVYFVFWWCKVCHVFSSSHWCLLNTGCVCRRYARICDADVDQYWCICDVTSGQPANELQVYPLCGITVKIKQVVRHQQNMGSNIVCVLGFFHRSWK